MQQPGVTAPIIGPRTMEQYEDNMEAMRIKLSEDDLRAIDAVSPPGDNVSPYYEADFGPSQFR
jgi:aryl-alcohol dehydrogenase-like predicted oxidoreductase